MKSSTMARGFGAFTTLTLAGVAVLVFHSAALAQQAKADAKDSAKDGTKTSPEQESEPGGKQEQPAELPPEYAPPPGYRYAPPQHGYPPPGYRPYYNDYYGPQGYPPPPPRYYRPRPYQQPPVRYYPEPVSYRTFFFGVGLGVGGVALFPEAGESSSRAGMSYNLHFGFGVSPHWSIVLAGDGAFSYFSGYDIDQSVWSIGPQVFLTRHLYARAGIGVATKSVDYSSTDYYYDYYYDTGFSDSGMGWTAALGWEFLQSYHTSLGLELAGTFGHYQNPDSITYSKNQGTIGVNFMLNLF